MPMLERKRPTFRPRLKKSRRQWASRSAAVIPVGLQVCKSWGYREVHRWTDGIACTSGQSMTFSQLVPITNKNDVLASVVYVHVFLQRGEGKLDRCRR